MEQKEFDIQEYMTGGVNRIVRDSLRATLRNPREARFMARFAKDVSRATKRRNKFKAQGEHIPPFLIASITSSCNLHCAGCYSRANHACRDEAPVDLMSAEEWEQIFRESEEIGISFILLAGGEPLLRRDIMEQASRHPAILFPVFTNGTYWDDDYQKLFSRNRNLVPIFSIEGGKEETDARRGEGIYQTLVDNMKRVSDAGMVFGASVTVTTENLEEVYSPEFLNKLSDLGCRAVIYVEFVPVTEEAAYLAPGEQERILMDQKLAALRQSMEEMVFVAFPGDEKESEGCVAAGRGFFHINANGGAEPCPFSPYSDTNIRGITIREALQSPLFREIRQQGLLLDDHIGGCTLFQVRDKVEALVEQEN